MRWPGLLRFVVILGSLLATEFAFLRPTVDASLAVMSRENGDKDSFQTAPIAILLPQAKAGDRDAQYGVGLAYEHGRGVPKDHKEAVKWFRRAAEQGLATAQNWMGYIYEHGSGLPQD